MYYFIGGRNTKSGNGLGVLRYSPGFPIEYLEKIEKECLEIEVDSPEIALEIKIWWLCRERKSMEIILMEEHM